MGCHISYMNEVKTCADRRCGAEEALRARHVESSPTLEPLAHVVHVETQPVSSSVHIEPTILAFLNKF